MLETRERTIDGFAYKVTQLTARTGNKVGMRLTKTLAGAAGAKDVESALGGIIAKLSEEDLEFICDTLARQTQVQLEPGKWPMLSDVFDIHFAGRYLEMLKWLGFALEVNFGAFFRVLLQSADGAEKGSSVSKFLRIATGSSGGS